MTENMALSKGRAAVLKALQDRKTLMVAEAPRWIESPEKFAVRVIRLAMDVWDEHAYLRTCDAGSFVRTIMRCAEIGLEPNSPTQQAYIVPRDGKACLEIHGRGWSHIAQNQGVLREMFLGVVHKRDEFEFDYAPRWHFRHTPYQGEDDPGPMTHAYAVGIRPDGQQRHVVLNRHQLDQMAAVSDRVQKGKNKSWKENPEGMAKAKAAKWFFKEREIGLDPSMLLQRAVSYDDEADTPKEAEVEIISPRGKVRELMDEAQSKPDASDKRRDKPKDGAQKTAEEPAEAEQTGSSDDGGLFPDDPEASAYVQELGDAGDDPDA